MDNKPRQQKINTTLVYDEASNELVDWIDDKTLETLSKKESFRQEQKAQLIERLARLEHEQWVHWTTELMQKIRDLPRETRNRWTAFQCPYEELPESVKEKDRVWARKVLEVIQQ